MSSEDDEKISKELTLLRTYRDTLTTCCEKLDLLKFSNGLCKLRIISLSVKEDFNSIDGERVDLSLRVRYILKIVFDKIRHDKVFFPALLEALSGCGRELKSVCDILNKEYQKHQKKPSGSVEEVVQDPERPLTEDDIPDLMDPLASVAHKWEEISIGLRIPLATRVEIRRDVDSFVIKLNRVLHGWVSGDYLKPVTLNTLKSVLVKPMVGLSSVAETLSLEDPLPAAKNPQLNKCCYDSDLRIFYQHRNVCVAYGKSTLLEVKVTNTSSSVSYQWSNDGCEISDGDNYQGASSSILLVCHRNMSSKHIEGKYVCQVEGKVSSEEIQLEICYPDRIKHILDGYKKLEAVPKDSWPPRRAESFVELALINRNSDKMQDYYYSIRGDMDDVLKEKVSINYYKAFGRYESGALVLVEGRPGCGKTTLAHKVTRDWSVGEKVLVGAELVLLIPLRILNINQKDSDIYELIEYIYKTVNDTSIGDYIINTRGDKICFILDGLDEYRSKGIESNTIVEQLLKTTLSKAMVIVFSRPVGTLQLKKSQFIDTHIEILGFRRDQIDSYIDSYFGSSPDMAVGLKQYLDLHINVLHMCYLPVHASMISYLYSQERDNIPNTETQIYSQFASSTICRKLMREDENFKILNSLSDLKESNKKCFVEICKLAFEMTKESKQVFQRHENEVQLCDEFGSDGPSLGLVTVDFPATTRGYEDFYSFLHLTFQEFLAAYYVYRLAEDEQFRILSECRNHEAMLVVWKFYCGLIGLEPRSYFQKQLSLIFTSDYADTLYRVHCAFESQQSMAYDSVLNLAKGSCLLFENKMFSPADYNAIGQVISNASSEFELQIHSCMLDKNGIEHLKNKVTKRNLGFLKVLLACIKDTTVDQLQALNILLRELTALETLDLGKTLLTKNAISILTESVKLPQLKTLKIPFIPISDGYIEVLRLLNFNSAMLESVHVNPTQNKTDNQKYISCLKTTFHSCSIVGGDYDNKITDMNSIALDIYQEFHTVSYCKTFLLSNCGIDDTVMERLSEALKKSMSIEKMVLDFNKISGEGAASLASSLQCSSSLKHLSVACNLIDDSGAKALASVLCQCNSLVHLDLEGNRIGTEGAIAVAEAVKDRDLELHLWNHKITEEGVLRILDYKKAARVNSPIRGNLSNFPINISSFTRALKCCTSLPSIMFSRIGISAVSSSLLNQLVAQLPQFNNLKHLYLCSLGIKLNVSILLKGLKSCTNLQTLDIHDNSIGSEDTAALVGLKSCTNLQTLDISKNSLGSEGVAALVNGLKSCTNLQTLDISKNSLGSEGVAALVNGLKSCTNLQTLYIRDNSIGSEGAAALAEGLKSCTNLQTLDISWNSIGSEGAAALAEGLKSCTNLRTLKISWNSICSEGAGALAEGLKSCTNLQTLDIRDNSIDSEGAAALAEGLMSCTNLRTLDISWNSIGSEGAAALAEGLKSCTNLRTLKISVNSIGSEGAAALAEGLKSCTNLQTLDIRDNSIGSEGAAALAEGLKSCTNLQTLDIRDNSIGSEGAAALAEGLKSCTNLQTLDIRDNSIGSECAAALAEGLKSCTNLQTLDISCNSIGSERAAALAEVLKSCTNLRTLDISWNGIGSDGAAALAEGLKSCTNLRTLKISWNSIGSEGVAALAEGLKSCTNLQTLDISWNSIGSKHAAALAEGLNSCTILQILDTSRNSIGSECAAALAEGLKSCTNLQT